MLSEHDRRALNHIENQLREEDPDLAGCFTDWRRPVGRARSWPYTATTVFFLVLMAGSLVLASVGMFWTTMMLTAAAVGLRKWRVGKAFSRP